MNLPTDQLTHILILTPIDKHIYHSTASRPKPQAFPHHKISVWCVDALWIIPVCLRTPEFPRYLSVVAIVACFNP